MCGNCGDPNHGADFVPDDLADLIDGTPLPTAPRQAAPAAEVLSGIRGNLLHSVGTPLDSDATLHIEKCPACRGRGRFISWAGRDCGPCFKCKGKGSRTFKADAATRAHNRATAAARKERVAADSWQAFQESHPDQAAWIVAHLGDAARGFDFPIKMQDAIRKFGSLSDGQLAAIDRGITCAICGAELTNAESIARGIGPICAGKFGW